MTVQELIDHLQNLPNKTLEVLSEQGNPIFKDGIVQDNETFVYIIFNENFTL